MHVIFLVPPPAYQRPVAVTAVTKDGNVTGEKIVKRPWPEPASKYENPQLMERRPGAASYLAAHDRRLPSAYVEERFDHGARVPGRAFGRQCLGRRVRALHDQRKLIGEPFGPGRPAAAG